MRYNALAWDGRASRLQLKYMSATWIVQHSLLVAHADTIFSSMTATMLFASNPRHDRRS